MINKKISNKINNINFILSIFIVSLHSSCIDLLNMNNFSGYYILCLLKFFNVLFDIAVPMFFMISAFLLYSKFEPQKYLVVLKKRLKSLVIPYFSWSFIAWIFFVFLTKIDFLSKFINREAVSINFKSILYDILMGTYNQPIWFLRTLFFFVLLSPVIYYIIISFKKYVLIFCLAIILLNCFLKPNYSGVLFWIPVYIFGAWYGHFGNKNPKGFSRENSIFSGALLLMIITFIVIFKINEKGILYYLYRNFAPVLFWIFIDLFPKIGGGWTLFPFH